MSKYSNTLMGHDLLRWNVKPNIAIVARLLLNGHQEAHA
jgi:hypothetical protein